MSSSTGFIAAPAPQHSLARYILLAPSRHLAIPYPARAHCEFQRDSFRCLRLHHSDHGESRTGQEALHMYGPVGAICVVRNLSASCFQVPCPTSVLRLRRCFRWIVEDLLGIGQIFCTDTRSEEHTSEL